MGGIIVPLAELNRNSFQVMKIMNDICVSISNGFCGDWPSMMSRSGILLNEFMMLYPLICGTFAQRGKRIYLKNILNEDTRLQFVTLIGDLSS